MNNIYPHVKCPRCHEMGYLGLCIDGEKFGSILHMDSLPKKYTETYYERSLPELCDLSKGMLSKVVKDNNLGVWFLMTKAINIIHEIKRSYSSMKGNNNA